MSADPAKTELSSRVRDAKDAALEILRHNMRGPCQGLPRTAGWGYPEPYTRDLMICGPGMLLSGEELLVDGLRRTLSALAENQSSRGHIPSLAHDPSDRGASDTTPLFLFCLAAFREHTGESAFLEEAAQRALTWMIYQSPDDTVMVAQLPTSDWRDEQWVLGYGLFVNAVVYTYLRQYGREEEAKTLHRFMHRLDIRRKGGRGVLHEGLSIPHHARYAMCSYKIYHDERFDLVGNSWAILAGLASRSRADAIVSGVERDCAQLREEGKLVVDLPPCLLPYIEPSDPDWRERYQQFNQPGTYHNGGVWPYVVGLYIAAAVAAGRPRLARRKLEALADLVKPWHENECEWGFNEWINAKTGLPSGRDWQTWSAAMFLYAAICVERNETPFFVRT